MTERTRAHYGLPEGDIWTWTDADQQLLDDTPVEQLRGLYKLARLSMFDLYKDRDALTKALEERDAEIGRVREFAVKLMVTYGSDEDDARVAVEAALQPTTPDSEGGDT